MRKTITIVLVTHVDVIDELGVELQKPLGEVCVYRCGVKKTQVEARLAHGASFLQVPANQAALVRVW